SAGGTSFKADWALTVFSLQHLKPEYHFLKSHISSASDRDSEAQRRSFSFRALKSPLFIWIELNYIGRR
ncbi:hypothetical protein Ocin01_06384, partial [Orchesella cincta]